MCMHTVLIHFVARVADALRPHILLEAYARDSLENLAFCIACAQQHTSDPVLSFEVPI